MLLKFNSILSSVFHYCKFTVYTKQAKILQITEARALGLLWTGNTRPEPKPVDKFEQPGLVESGPAHGSGVGTRWFLRFLPTQTMILWFYETILWFCEIDFWSSDVSPWWLQSHFSFKVFKLICRCCCYRHYGRIAGIHVLKRVIKH